MGTIAFLLFVVSLILGLLLWFTKQRSEKKGAENSAVIRDLTDRNQILSRYEGILQIDREIETRKYGIEQERAKAESDIRSLRVEAETEVKETKKEIRDLKRETQEMQAKALESASRKAAHIVEEANRKADEVAGDAMVALRDSKQIEATAKAMKNIIKGYGDEYLIPGHSLLDDLAEEYSHKEAGVELKTAREHSRQMVSSRLAADCDYSEKRRKETAIHFVLDAFNGKVDSILSRAKHDNFGKLDQELADTFNLVNSNGEAFRNARIQSAYMEARKAELRWAVVVNELRIEEREEQRAIKEQMREEERARKEYEKAIKDAAKEEKLLRNAMIKARKELESASAEQQVEFQKQLEELEQRLREAEEKNQRAISMAQQTKQGHVYVISNVGSFGDDVFKIGLTRRLEPTDRVHELGDASVPFHFDIHAMMFSKDAPALETELHRVFKDYQVNLVNPRKEFFRVGISDIKKFVQEMGIEAKWTMVAEAHEYRETLATLKSQGKVVRELPPPDSKVTTRSVPVTPVPGTPVSVSTPRATAAMVDTPVSASTVSSVSACPPELPKHSPNKNAQTQPPAASSEQEHPRQVRSGNGDSRLPASPGRSNDRVVLCPGCKGPLAVSTLRVGKNACPHCGRTFKVRGK